MKKLVAIGGLVIAAAVYLGGTTLVGSGAALRGQAADMHAALMRLEDRVPAGTLHDTQWKVFIAEVDRAVAAGDRSAAAYQWRHAYALALGTHGWEPLLEVGNAALRVDAMSPERRADHRNAREAYMAALLRARRAASAEGTEAVAEGFAGIGDGETARLVRAMSLRYAAANAGGQF